MPHVILIEDDALVRKLLEKRIQQAGWHVSAFRDARNLREYLFEQPADLVVVDLGLPHMDGLAVVEMLRASGVDLPVLVLTAYELPHLYATVRGMGANDLVYKPYDQEDLIERMRALIAA